MTRSPTISFLVPDISSPTVGAAVRLASCLEEHWTTQIVGPDFGGGVCSMYRDAYPFTVVPANRLYRFPDYFWERHRLGAAVKGDVVVALKAYANTVPVAFSIRRKRNTPVLVYLDEWDGALWHQLSPQEKRRCWRDHWHHPLEACHHAWVERMIPGADGVISSTTFLQQRLGGDVLHAGVDTELFKPQPKKDVERLRAELGLQGKRVIVFGGVVRPHKGVEEIVEALCRLGGDRNRLLVAGPRTDHLDALCRAETTGRYVVVAGAPVHDPSNMNAEVHARMPLYLDAGDLVVLPLRDTLLAQSQMPIKLFEAMAMAKPIVASEVSDLPEVLRGCGCVVPPGDQSALTSAIGNLLDHPEQARPMGEAAREKCIRLYSGEVTKRRLFEILERVIASRPPSTNNH